MCDFVLLAPCGEGISVEDFASGINRESQKSNKESIFLLTLHHVGSVDQTRLHSIFDTFQKLAFLENSPHDVAVKHQADVHSLLSINVWQMPGADHRGAAAKSTLTGLT